jgi:hypothetical protein
VLPEDSPLSEIDVYGLDHSPWVQTVLLGLHDRSVPHTLRTTPPLSVFVKSGIMMPAARIDDGPWQLESTEILQRVGYAPISSTDRMAIYAAWQGVGHRTDRALRFWREFSFCRDPHPSLLPRLRNHFFRSFATLYFYLLIRFMVLFGNRPDPENFEDQFRFWEERLEQSDGPFIGGANPDTLDMLLFGIIQCHCSISVPPIAALQESPDLTRLRAWIGAMHKRFSDYDHLYSGVYFEPHLPLPRRTTALEQAAFWVGSVFMVAALPITLPLILFFALRAQRIPPDEEAPAPE